MITLGLEIHGDVAQVWTRERGEVVMREVPLADLGAAVRAVYAAKEGTDAGDDRPVAPPKDPADRLFAAAQEALPKVLSRLGRLQDYRQRGRRAYP